MTRRDGHVAFKLQIKTAYRTFLGKHEQNIFLARPKRTLEDNIETDFDEIGSEGVDRIRLATDKIQWLAVFNTVMNHGVHSKWRGFVSS
jgi:hypothetical protein